MRFLFLIATMLYCSIAYSAELVIDHEKMQNLPAGWVVNKIYHNGSYIGDIAFRDTGSRLKYEVINRTANNIRLEIKCEYSGGALANMVGLGPGEGKRGEFNSVSMSSGSCGPAMMRVNLQ